MCQNVNLLLLFDTIFTKSLSNYVVIPIADFIYICGISPCIRCPKSTFLCPTKSFHWSEKNLIFANSTSKQSTFKDYGTLVRFFGTPDKNVWLPIFQRSSLQNIEQQIAITIPPPQSTIVHCAFIYLFSEIMLHVYSCE